MGIFGRKEDNGSEAGASETGGENGGKKLGLAGLFRRKKNEQAAAREERADWEDFDLEAFKADMDHRAVEAGALQAKKGPDRIEGQGMSAHPDDDDLSFEALMEQFHQYEMEVDGHVTDWTEEEDDEEDRRRRKHREEREPRADLLQSRAGRGAKDGVSRAEVGTRGYDRRTSLREPRTPGFGSSSPLGSRGREVRFGTASSAGSRDSRGQSEDGFSRPETSLTLRSGLSSRAGARAGGEPMGDALMLDAEGLFNCCKQNLLSIPMDVYEDQDDDEGPVKILWAHQNRIKWLPAVVGRLTALTELRLHENKIETLPPEFANLTALRKLWLNENELAECPKELGALTNLRMLSLSRNPFTELCDGIGRLKMVEDLQLHELNLKVPPREIITRGPKRIVEYMIRIRNASQACLLFSEGKSADGVDMVPTQHKLWKLNHDATNQNDWGQWRERQFSIDFRGVLKYSSKQREGEEIRVGPVRQMMYEQQQNRINFPFKISFKGLKTTLILAAEKSRERKDFVENVKIAQQQTCGLFLQDFGLTAIPIEAVRLTELTQLNLSNNQIKSLPRLLMPMLESLVLDFNYLSVVPRTIYEDLSALTRLSLVENPLVRLPTDIGQMPHIKELEMNINFRLESPPTVVLAHGMQLQFLRKMREAEDTGIMDLAEFHLQDVPREIGKRWDEHPEYHNVTQLRLSGNKIVDIDQGIDNFVKLISLDLNNNRLHHLPRQVGIMVNIGELLLDDNELREIPKSFRYMTKLFALHINNNEMHLWPPPLEYLVGLTDLQMQNNAIEIVPPSVSSLVNLKELWLDGNKISSLPVEVAAWTSLTELHMNNNLLPHLPETLGLLAKLEVVAFNKNQIDNFPSEVGNWRQLRVLDIAHNNVPFLPASICHSTAMKKLLLEGNPMCQLPLSMGSMRSLSKLSYSQSGKWISPSNQIMSKTPKEVISYLQAYDNALQTGHLDLSYTGMEYLHGDVCALTGLTRLSLRGNQLNTLNAVVGEADGRWIWLKKERDAYVPDVLFAEKRAAKEAMLAYLGPGLNNRQLRERAERVFAQIDEDGGGTLDMKELQKCFFKLRVEVSEKVIEMLIAEVSNDGDDEVDMGEWTRLVNNIYKGAVDVQGIGDLRNLTSLDISENKLKRLPYGLGFCTNLQQLILDEPHTVIIPCDDILRTSRDDASIVTRYLRCLHDAMLTGTLELNGFIVSVLPKELLELKNLTELNMSSNSLRVVVAEIEELSLLKSIDFSYNRIKLLPANIGKLRKLEVLDVQSNKLKHLPAVLCTMNALHTVYTVGNKELMIPKEVQNAGTTTLKLFLRGVYTGSNDAVVNWSELHSKGEAKLREVPEILFQMNWVTDVNLDHNNVHSLPKDFGQLRSMTKLSLRDNHLDKVPKEMKKCKALERLLLDKNKLDQLPMFVYTSLPLKILSLSHNLLESDCIPEDLPVGAASCLQALILDHNKMGKLSTTVELFQAMQYLSFNFNSVSTLPPELAQCRALTDLQFDGNKVYELPEDMKMLTNLIRLKLNDNQIDVLPHWVGGMRKLQHLSLGNNKLQYIPYNVTQLKLKVLTLDGNPLAAVETGVLQDGAKGVMDFLSYNHNYDLADRNMLPDPLEQRRQIGARINTYSYGAEEIRRRRLEAGYKNVGGMDVVELAYNKRVGDDRTNGEGAIILDEEMLWDVRMLAEREVACRALYAFLGPNLTGDVVRAKAKEVFIKMDADGSGTMDEEELRECFMSMGAKLSLPVIHRFMDQGLRDPERGIQVEDFQHLVYSVYSSM